MATSAIAAARLQGEFQKRGIPVRIIKATVSDLRNQVRQYKPDLVVSTAVVQLDTDIPVFSGVPLLSGIGQRELLDQIFKAVEKVLAS